MDKRIVLALLLLSACSPVARPAVVLHGEKDVAVSVEIADEPAEQEKGLMYRTSLDAGAGMLFVFPTESDIGFWMKNTKIPLDMFFINSQGIIVDINYDAEPCIQEPCKVYRNIARYVLETNAGFAVKNNLKEGDSVTLPELK